MNAKRFHSLSAAGAGDLGPIDAGDILGPCPSCATELRVTSVENPRTGRTARALVHPVPFCAYYGATDPSAIERAIERGAKEN